MKKKNVVETDQDPSYTYTRAHYLSYRPGLFQVTKEEEKIVL